MSDLSDHQTVRTPAGDLAYTDVGSGPPLVFLHGNPTSARLFRYLISALHSDYRCVAPDYLGFGRSAAPPDFSYRPPSHATQIEALLRRLDLTRITLVLHDWGGPIGLSYALRYPATVHRLVLFNTWAWPLTHRPLLYTASRLIDTPLGRLSIQRYNAFARLGMPWTVGPTPPRCPAWINSYAEALNTSTRRYACWMFARSLTTESTWLRSLWTQRRRLRARPALLCWGMADPAFGTEVTLRRWYRLFENSTVHRLERVGHYVPEETETRLTPLVSQFLEATDPGKGEA